MPKFLADHTHPFRPGKIGLDILFHQHTTPSRPFGNLINYKLCINMI